MKFIKKSDVERHLVTGASDKLLPFRCRTQPDATGYSNEETRRKTVNTTIPGARPDRCASVLPVTAAVFVYPVQPSTAKASQG